ncbi:MAG: heavy metal-associated domain-containing protein [Mariprofundaceae bacterium]|nr:heavy metal-associated domain-containing protein [Mariprofundaceae bacterium]
MRILQTLLTIALLSTASVSTVFAQGTTEQTATIQVDGLSCPFCTYGLEKNLKKVKGVGSVHIDMKAGKATVLLKTDANVDDQALRKAVEKAGFTPRDIKRR